MLLYGQAGNLYFLVFPVSNLNSVIITINVHPVVYTCNFFGFLLRPVWLLNCFGAWCGSVSEHVTRRL